MKRFAILISSAVLALGLFGCASGDSESADNAANDSQAQSSAAAEGGDGATDGTAAEEVVDIHGFSPSVSEPPISCTKEAKLQNVTIMVPEEWTAEVGIGGYLKINSGDTIAGTMSVEESDLNSQSSDEEVLAFINETLETQKSNGFTITDEMTVQRAGDLAYVIVPFKATSTDENGDPQDYWGYSFCGYANELIVADLSCEEDNKDVLETFRWILENVQVDTSVPIDTSSTNVSVQ